MTVTLPTTEPPLWERTHQETWWYAASIHADNTPQGTPRWARDIWDDVVRIDPDAPVGIRPFWVMKTGGLSPLTDELPWGLGSGTNSISAADLANELEAIHDDFGVTVSPPGLASFANIINDGHVQPRYWVDLDLKRRVLEAVGMPNAVVIIEETANSFVGEGQHPMPGVGDEQGAQFMRAAMYGGMQSNMPTAHFMLYHRWSNWNDISDPVEGKLRRAVAIGLLDQVRETNSPAPEGGLVLDNPLGKEVDESKLLG